jgi:hypothetical protein
MKHPRAFYPVLFILFVLFAVDITLKIVKSRFQLDIPRRSAREMSGIPGESEKKPLSAYSKIVERNLFHQAPGSVADDDRTDDGHAPGDHDWQQGARFFSY